MPFLLNIFYQPMNLFKELVANLRKVLYGDLKAALKACDYIKEVLRSARLQARQRKGLQQCAALICAPHQKLLIDRLQLDHNKVHYLSFPMDASVLAEVDRHEVSRLQEKYGDVDILFFHPTRQFYIRESSDRFLKDNDKLLYAYARFLGKTTKRVKLLLVLKGREGDIAYSQRLIREMNLEGDVEWLPEMPNKRLRAYYTLNQVVLCDQYSPHLAILGNTGREATFYGRPIISAFAEWNRAYYGQDLPMHVFPAQTVDEIVSAMGKVASLSPEEREELSNGAVQWFRRNLDSQSLLPKYMDLFSNVSKSFS
jgi:glycosyltransferase involved in cell wall biosynthesis